MKKYTDGYKFGLDEYSDVAIYCYENGRGYITEVESDNDERMFQLVIVSEPTKEEITAQKRAQATSLEARIAAIEAMLAEVYGGEE